MKDSKIQTKLRVNNPDGSFCSFKIEPDVCESVIKIKVETKEQELFMHDWWFRGMFNNRGELRSASSYKWDGEIVDEIDRGKGEVEETVHRKVFGLFISKIGERDNSKIDHMITLGISHICDSVDGVFVG